ncbi:hypothetical protein Poly24_09030 [Rosistilla carotiformis]|uniref:Uncharacterized protein n=1 Tax=Rosistilla carotiformis TaxID=2528017 RepID=A0A518JNT2_9BACT|nr:hypothetical protein [Rosistilla carotiformis]QDV67210.1 hypothetical protein Poly24_09030 [Rosistilla carotiformis]
MTDWNEAEVDEAWKQFETSWRRGKPLNMWDAISAVSPVYRRDLAVEFAMIDLEWRWRLGVDNEPRDTRYYADILAALQLNPEHYVSILEHEYIVRSQWGDRPTIDEMLVGLPASEQLRRIFETALDENFPVYCFLKNRGERFLEHRKKLVTVFGRQQAEEPEKFALLSERLSTRCVIANAVETSIAPAHLELRRVGADRIVAEVLVADAKCLAADQLLLPRQPVELQLPQKLQIEDYELVLDCGF